ncbi:MAG: hypothetical protein EPO02_10295 [Nitrospirae bacterium]|nr:MAG: hypothetical protein EPO02_10295 [Nitrospirota bacterium]
MPAKGKQQTPRKAKAAKAGKPLQARNDAGREKGPALSGKTAQSGGGDLAAEVKRLARELETVRLELSRRPSIGGEGGGGRRDQDKVVADRLARLDEKVDSVWNRLADLEERIEGEGTRHGHDADDFDEAPEKDYYER